MKLSCKENKLNKSRIKMMNIYKNRNKQLKSRRMFSPYQYGHVKQAYQVPYSVPNLNYWDSCQYENRFQVQNTHHNNFMREGGNFSNTGPPVRCTPWDVQWSSGRCNSSDDDMYRRSGCGSGYSQREDCDFSNTGPPVRCTPLDVQWSSRRCNSSDDDMYRRSGYRQGEHGDFSNTGPPVRCTPLDVQWSSGRCNSSDDDMYRRSGYRQGEDGDFSNTGPPVRCTPWDVQWSSGRCNSWENDRRSGYFSGNNVCEDDSSFAGLNLEVNNNDQNILVPVGNLINMEPHKFIPWNVQERNHTGTGMQTTNNVQTTNCTDSITYDVKGLGEQFSLLQFDIFVFPSQWSACSLEETGFVDVPLESIEGKSINQFFNRTSQSKDFQLNIVGVTRIENPYLYSMYMLKKEEMKSCNGHVNELYLYHGTKIKHIDKICEDNLDWRMFKKRHRFGQGVSFSPLSTYSSHYCNSSEIKVMLLFKVLVSNAVVGSEDMAIPPNDAKVTFDTSIKSDASVIVKYSDNEFYPLYKIMFKKFTNIPSNAPIF